MNASRLGSLLLSSAFGLALAAAPSSSSAQDPAPAAPAAAPAEPATAPSAPPAKPIPPGFERVAGAPDTEKIDASPLVVGAYAAFFVGLFGYLVWVARQQSAIARELVALAERLRRAERR